MNPTNRQAPGIASAPVLDALVVLGVNPETGLTRAETLAHHAAIRAIGGTDIAPAATAAIGRLPGLVAVVRR